MPARPAARTPPAAFAASYRPFAVLCGAGAVLVAVTALSQGLLPALTRETGGVQMFGVILFFYGAVLTAALAASGDIPPFEVSGAFVLLALRELDFHNWWFEPGVLHANFYTGPAPIWQKAIGLCLVSLILWVALRLIVRGARPFLAGLKARAGWAWVLFAGLALGWLSTVIDGAGRKLAPYGITLDDATYQAVIVTEELLELGFTLCAVLAVTLFVRRRAGLPGTAA